MGETKLLASQVEDAAQAVADQYFGVDGWKKLGFAERQEMRQAVVKAAEHLQYADALPALPSDHASALAEIANKILDACGAASDDPVTVDDALICIRQLVERRDQWQEQAEKKVAEMKREIERLKDLVRHQRHALYDEKLISDEEFADLVADSDNGKRVARLESYDGVRKQLTAAQQRIGTLTGVLGALTAACWFNAAGGGIETCPPDEATLTRAIEVLDEAAALAPTAQDAPQKESAFEKVKRKYPEANQLQVNGDWVIFSNYREIHSLGRGATAEEAWVNAASQGETDGRN